ncbi:MAG: hypothetical protein ACI8XU_001586 [Kiritimatiellia bacterium]|jgi:hypothetical protein
MAYLCSCLAVFDVGLYALPFPRVIPSLLAASTHGQYGLEHDNSRFQFIDCNHAKDSALHDKEPKCSAHS